MADIDWTGGAADIEQIDTLTPALVWAADDTIDLTSHDATLTITVGSDADLEDIANMIVRAINSEPVVNETRTTDGKFVPGWNGNGGTGRGNRVWAKANNSSGSWVVYVYGRPGHPFDLGASATTAGTGTLTLTSDGTGESQVCTGKHFRTNVKNYSTGALPTGTDTLHFRDGSIDMLYDLNDATAAACDTFKIWPEYGGNVGLPDIVQWGDNAIPYRTSFATHLLCNSIAAQTYTFHRGNGKGYGRFRIDMDTPGADSTIEVNKRGRRDSRYPTIPPLDIENIDRTTIRCSDADAKLVYTGTTSTPSLTVTPRDDENTTTYVEVRDTSADTTGPTGGITLSGGRVVIRESATYGSLTMRGGTFTLMDSTAMTSVTVSGGILEFKASGGPTGTNRFSGTSTLTTAGNPFLGNSIITDFELSGPEAKIIDPNGAFEELKVDCVDGAGPNQIIYKTNKNWTSAAV